MLVLGAFIAFETTSAWVPTNAVVGPALFPYLIAAGLVIVGLALLREALSATSPTRAASSWTGIAVVLVSVGLMIQILLLETLGWIPAPRCCSSPWPAPSAAGGS